MSFYSMIFGNNPVSNVILATLGFTRQDCGRFRDCFVANGKIAIYTRNGGGNRECWSDDPDSPDCACPGCIVTHRLPQHPNYLYDRDDDFDCTYATIYFSFPDEFADGLAAMDAGVEFEPSKRWIEAIEAIGNANQP